MEELEARRRPPFGDNPAVGDRGRATQQAILRAAVDAFDEAGYHHTSVEAITDRVGCSRATFYQYFDGKEELLRRLAGQLGDELGRLLDALEPIEPTRGGRHLVRGWLVDLGDVYTRYRPVADTYALMVRTDPAVVTGSNVLSRRYRDALERAVVDPRTDLADADVLSGTAAVLAYGAFHHHRLAPGPDAARFVDALADVVHRALFGPIDAVNLAPRRPRSIPPSGRWSGDGAAVDLADLRPKGRRTRAELLDAAATAFVRLGYDATRVNDIVDAAGLSHGAFYRYFDDKPAVFRELAITTSGEFVDHIRLLPDPPEGVAAWVSDHLGRYRTHQGLFSMWAEAETAGVDTSAGVVEEAASVIADALDHRDFGDVDADTVILTALLDRVPAATFATGAFTVDEAAAGLTAFVEHGMFGR